MKKNYAILLRKVFTFLFTCLFLLRGIQAQVVQTFSYTGSIQSFTVPPCVPTISVDVRGAKGGQGYVFYSNGGTGGRVVAVISVTPGQVLNINVGGIGANGTQGVGGTGGFNGGGTGASYASNYGGGGGGGASDIRVSPYGLSDRLIVAGGGGGGAYNYGTTDYDRGGNGGTTTGESGYAGGTAGGTGAGTGGSQTAGGIGGTYSGYCTATNGQQGQGGPGGTCTNSGGGGGGGYFGGGGGVWGGGGGGSNYAISTASSVVHTQGVNNAAGVVTFSYNFAGNIANASSSTPMICTGNSAVLTSTGMTTYTWSTGSFANNISVSPTSNTSYTVSATNSIGCVSSAVITVTVSSGVPTLAVTSSTNQTCLGKTATLTATGALSYTWSNNVTNGVSFTPSLTTTYTVLGQNGCGTTSAVTTITVAPLPVSVNVSPTVSCAGGGATLTSTSAGTSYTWFPNTTVHTASTIVSPTSTIVYTIAISDGTCFGTAMVTLSVNPIPTISIVPSASTSCQGGVVTMTASGGTTYTWTPGNINGATVSFTPGTSTLYNCVGSNSFNCTAGANQVVVTQPSPTITVVASDNLICGGTSATLTASGANSYTWSTPSNSPVITVSPANTTVYNVIGASTGNTCTTTKTIQVAVFNPVVSISGATAICNGGTATLTASGGDTYQWDNGAPVPVISVNPQTTTMYTVTAITASGNINCPSTATLQLVVNPNPTVTVVPTRTFMCVKESNTLTAGGASTYSWNTTETTAAIVISSTVATTINYSVVGTDAQGCKNVKIYQVKFNGCTGISEVNGTTNNISIYPNPNNGNFVLESISDVELRITNELGQLISNIKLDASNNHKASVQELPSGIYFVNGKNVNSKIVVEK